MMPVLVGLNEREGEDLAAMLINKRADDEEMARLFGLNDRSEEKRLSKLSEEARYETKTYQTLRDKKLVFQDNSRVKIDEDRLAYAVRHHREFFKRVENDLGVLDPPEAMKKKHAVMVLNDFSKEKGVAGQLAKELGLDDEEALATLSPPTDAMI